MVKLNLEHVLILAIAIFLLYHFVGRCNCFNGFSVGGDGEKTCPSNVDPNTKKYCQKCENGYVFEHSINKGEPTWRCTPKEEYPILPETLYYGICGRGYYDACENEVPNSRCSTGDITLAGNKMYACNCKYGYYSDGKQCIK